MKFVFAELGEKKISKTVDLQLPPGQSFQSIGFESVLDFMIAEAEPHIPDDNKRVECVPTDGQPDLMSAHYVIVHNGIHGVGNVHIYP